jgi:hypothetical protein
MYGIIFWGKDGEIIKVFWLQKQVIRLITGVSNANLVGILLGNLEY